MNSGNANAATGNRGLEDAARMQGAAAMAAGVREDRVAVASTGVIGVPMPMDGMMKAILAARAELAPDGDRAFWRAIATTDAFEKLLSLDVELPVGHRADQRPGEGRGDDPAGLRDDAVLRPDRRRARRRDRRAAARRLREALVRAHLGRRPALDERRRAADGVGRERRDRRAGVRRRAALRRGARLRAAAPGAADRARRRGRRPGRARARPRRPRRDGRGASPARSPTRRWSRPR